MTVIGINDYWFLDGYKRVIEARKSGLLRTSKVMVVNVVAPEWTLAIVSVMDVWSVLLAVGTLLIGSALTWFYGNRRTRLFITATENSERPPTFDGLTHLFEGHPVEHPAVREFWLKNLGPRDLGPSAFDGGVIRIETGGKIERVRARGGIGAYHDADEVTVDGSSFEINPRAIPASAEMRFRVLTSGKEGSLGCEVRLTDVSVSRRKAHTLLHHLFGAALSALGHILSLVLVLVVLVLWAFIPSWSLDHRYWLCGVLGSAVVLGLFTTKYGFQHGERSWRASKRQTLVGRGIATNWSLWS